MLHLAKEKNIKVISLTSNLDSDLAKISDICLLTKNTGEPKIRSGATTSLISQLYVVDILLFSYISNYPDEILERLKESAEATQKYKK